MKKCVFFDRDGIVNRSPGPGYVESWEQFHLLPEFVEALRIVRGAGFEAVIATNQRGAATGRITVQALEEMHNKLRHILETGHGLELLDVFYCPHEKDTCRCRKPLPGMLLDAAQKHNIDLKASWMVGDQEKDILAGKNAGCRTILVSTGKTAVQPDFQVKSMKELVSRIEDMIRMPVP